MSPLSPSTTRFSFVSSLVPLATIGLVWWWLLFILASMGQFSRPLVISALILVVVVTGYRFFRSPKNFYAALLRITPKQLFFSLSAFVGITLFFSFVFSPLLTAPTVFSGRDQGSYSLAAWQLAHSEHLASTSPATSAFFHQYGTGKALNFPGFAYTATGALVPQFPIGSIIWYAGFVSIFGLAGFYIANVITALFASLLFFCLLRFFLPLRFSVFGAALFALSFPIIWFGRFTLSENFALALFLFLCVETLRFLQRPSPTSLLLTGAIALALAITRIEGWAILGMLALTLISVSTSRQWLSKYSTQYRHHSIFAAALALIIIAWNLFLNWPFFRSLGGILWRHFSVTTSLADTGSTLSFIHSFLSLWQTLWLYNFAPIFVIGGFTVFLLAKKRQWSPLTPFLLALPTLLYLFNPQISDDHPWMLRRFAFTLWPISCFLTLIGIHTIDMFLRTHSNKQWLVRFFKPALLTSLTLSTLIVSLHFLPLVENPALLADTDQLATRFSPQDLVLVDRLASGNPFAMIAGPLQNIFGVQAVYFFNPADLPALDLTPFDHVYILTGIPESSVYTEAFPNQLDFKGVYTLHSTLFDDMSFEYGSLPNLVSQEITGFILEYHRSPR